MLEFCRVVIRKVPIEKLLKFKKKRLNIHALSAKAIGLACKISRGYISNINKDELHVNFECKKCYIHARKKNVQSVGMGVEIGLNFVDSKFTV